MEINNDRKLPLCIPLKEPIISLRSPYGSSQEFTAQYQLMQLVFAIISALHLIKSEGSNEKSI